ncbi:MAG: hypothetical protein ABEL76_08055 [Bradymonadaceae bacterium]
MLQHLPTFSVMLGRSRADHSVTGEGSIGRSALLSNAGLTTTEYLVLMALVGVTALVTIQMLGRTTRAKFQSSVRKLKGIDQTGGNRPSASSSSSGGESIGEGSSGADPSGSTGSESATGESARGSSAAGPGSGPAGGAVGARSEAAGGGTSGGTAGSRGSASESAGSGGGFRRSTADRRGSGQSFPWLLLLIVAGVLSGALVYVVFANKSG